MAAAASIYPPLRERPIKNTVLLFDVDETLSKARKVRSLNPNVSRKYSQPHV